MMKQLCGLAVSFCSLCTLCDLPVYDFKTYVASFVPLRADGKISIPKEVHHVKLDIGLSYAAPMSQQWLLQEEDLIVFGFEPNPTSVRSILEGATKFSGSWPLVVEKRFIGTRFFLIPCALGISEQKVVPFYVTAADCGCSSLFRPKAFAVKEVIEVPLFSLAAFFDLFPFDTHPVIDYIKIDAQGADLDIVKSAGHYLAEHVIYITIEAEDNQYEGTVNSPSEIDSYMKSIGFIPYRSRCTMDPTYLNSRYIEYVKQHQVIIFQQF
jgi:hypothetical protein